MNTHELDLPGTTTTTATIQEGVTLDGVDTVHSRITAEINWHLWETFDDVARSQHRTQHVAQHGDADRDAAPPAAAPLPPGLSEFASHGNSVGALSITGLKLPPNINPERAGDYYDHVLRWLATELGAPYGYASQAEGELITNLIPSKEDAAEQVGVGAVGGLSWHTEDAHFAHNCDVIVLLAVRGDPAAATLVSQPIPWLLPSSTLQTLREDEYVISSDGASTSSYSEQHSVIRIDDAGTSRLRYDPLFTEAPSNRHRAALHALTERINASYSSFTLGDRDILLIDNRTSVHARSRFAPRYDENDRWIKRIRVHRSPVPAAFTSSSATSTIAI